MPGNLGRSSGAAEKQPRVASTAGKGPLSVDQATPDPSVSTSLLPQEDRSTASSCQGMCGMNRAIILIVAGLLIVVVSGSALGITMRRTKHGTDNGPSVDADDDSISPDPEPSAIPSPPPGPKAIYPVGLPKPCSVIEVIAGEASWVDDEVGDFMKKNPGFIPFSVARVHLSNEYYMSVVLQKPVDPTGYVWLYGISRSTLDDKMVEYASHGEYLVSLTSYGSGSAFAFNAVWHSTPPGESSAWALRTGVSSLQAISDWEKSNNILDSFRNGGFPLGVQQAGSESVVYNAYYSKKDPRVKTWVWLASLHVCSSDVQEKLEEGYTIVSIDVATRAEMEPFMSAVLLKPASSDYVLPSSSLHIGVLGGATEIVVACEKDNFRPTYAVPYVDGGSKYFAVVCHSWDA